MHKILFGSRSACIHVDVVHYIDNNDNFTYILCTGDNQNWIIDMKTINLALISFVTLQFLASAASAAPYIFIP